jgi:hypothetical protein
MNAGWFNLILFLVLAGVIILCAFNVATYSDIKNGNTNAPDITDGECTAMIVINTILLVTASLTLIYYILKVYQGAVEIYESDVIYKDGKVSGFEGKYKANNRWTQIFLWLFSTFTFIVSLFNLINTTKLNNSDANNAVSSSGSLLAFSWIFFFIALGYFLYTTFRTLSPKKLREVEFFTLSSVFGKSLVAKPTIPQIMVGECKGKVTMDEFNKYLAGTLHLSGAKPFNVLDNIRINY